MQRGKTKLPIDATWQTTDDIETESLLNRLQRLLDEINKTWPNATPDRVPSPEKTLS